MEYMGSADFETLFHALRSKFHSIFFWLCIPSFKFSRDATVFFILAKAVAFLCNKNILLIRSIKNVITSVIAESSACRNM